MSASGPRVAAISGMSLAAEQGTISWSKLREVARKASPDTDGYWLALVPEIQRQADSKTGAADARGALPVTSLKRKTRCAPNSGVR